MKHYRKIWEEAYGPIPVDENGRTYEIHHINGNRNDNRLENLACMPIEEHFQTHYENGDYGACVLIAKRMAMTPEEISNIQRGVKRPGIGGVKKGTIPWNKGVKGYKCNSNGQGKGSKNAFVERWKDDWDKFVSLYESRPPLEKAGDVQRNGRVLPYDRIFANTYYEVFPVGPAGLYNIIKNLEKYKEWMKNV